MTKIFRLKNTSKFLFQKINSVYEIVIQKDINIKNKLYLLKALKSEK
jgi:hypothetical protein